MGQSETVKKIIRETKIEGIKQSLVGIDDNLLNKIDNFQLGELQTLARTFLNKVEKEVVKRQSV